MIPAYGGGQQPREAFGWSRTTHHYKREDDPQDEVGRVRVESAECMDAEVLIWS